MRTQSPDTSVAAEREHIRLLWEAGPARRLARALELSDMTRALAWNARIKSEPEPSHDARVARFVELHRALAPRRRHGVAAYPKGRSLDRWSSNLDFIGAKK